MNWMPRSGLAIAALSSLTMIGGGCADQDACKGQSATCLSLTLSGEGVMQADQLEVMVLRQPKPEMPMMPLGEPKPLPFKVAILWPDGPGTVSVRSYVAGTLNGVTPELTLDLRNGAHDMRMLTLYPPIAGTPEDFGPPLHRDMSGTADMVAPPDLLPPPADMTQLPDMSSPLDMTAPADMPLPTD